MKIMTMYIAYDDTEFTDETKYHAYEAKAFDLINEALDTYIFYDRNKNIILPEFDNIEEFLRWFDITTDNCEYIKVERDISRALHKFLWSNIGTCVPEEQGFYKYDWHKCEWVSAG